MEREKKKARVPAIIPTSMFEALFSVPFNGYLSPVQTSSWKNTGAAHEIRIGGTSAGGERHLFGHVRNLRIWHKELTDAQMGESVE